MTKLQQVQRCHGVDLERLQRLWNFSCEGCWKWWICLFEARAFSYTCYSS